MELARRGMRSRFARLIGDIGPGHGLLYLVQRAVAALRLPVAVHAYLIVEQPTGNAPRLVGRRARAYTSRPIEDGDPAFADMPLDAATIAFRRAQGARCLGLFREGRLAAYIWFCLEGYDEDEVRCRFRPLPPDETAWDFDVYVLPEFRNGLAFAALWDHADAALRAAGRTRSMSRISAFNTQSRASHRRLGAVELARASFVRMGSFQLMVASRRPWLHVGFGPKSRPVIEFGG